MSDLELDTLTIIKYPDPRLRKACDPVTVFDDNLRALATRMVELMNQAEGIGLAAPQVGILSQMFVCGVIGKPDEWMAFVNPTLADLDGPMEAAEEGCLSIPDVNVTIRRAVSCRIDALDLDGNPIAYTASDLIARCWQHECDHLQGRLIVDRMSPADQVANRRALKRLESRFRG
ncbi:MAG: peptide deformylase [Phycisphaerales bacterium]|nr:peptide deformylase [Phycisphaerales bacterium]MCB9857083.1 peptide deformylase [Phycisphaerales bacterium]MCB9861790.1 peptide deformylase [Phycisphaerales bacterium]